jgi:hypothetical protein
MYNFNYTDLDMWDPKIYTFYPKCNGIYLEDIPIEDGISFIYYESPNLEIRKERDLSEILNSKVTNINILIGFMKYLYKEIGPSAINLLIKYKHLITDIKELNDCLVLCWELNNIKEDINYFEVYKELIIDNKELAQGKLYLKDIKEDGLIYQIYIEKNNILSYGILGHIFVSELSRLSKLFKPIIEDEIHR